MQNDQIKPGSATQQTKPAEQVIQKNTIDSKD